MKIGEMQGHRGTVMLPRYNSVEVTLRPDKRSDGSCGYIMETADNTPVGYFLPVGTGYVGNINGGKAKILAGRTGHSVYTSA